MGWDDYRGCYDPVLEISNSRSPYSRLTSRPENDDVVVCVNLVATMVVVVKSKRIFVVNFFEPSLKMLF